MKANRMLDRILERAPSDARALAVLEREGERYHCSVEIGAASGPLVARTADERALIALEKAERCLRRTLEKWRDRRFRPTRSEKLRPMFSPVA